MEQEKEYQNQDKSQDKDKKKKKRWKYIIASIIVILVLILGVIISTYLLRLRTTFTGRAYGSSENVRIELANSYLFASPLKAKAGGSEKIRVTVFILDSQGKGVLGKEVVLKTDNSLTVVSVQKLTDDLGRAIFDVSSIAPGDFVVEASVDNRQLPQVLSINFN